MGYPNFFDTTIILSPNRAPEPEWDNNKMGMYDTFSGTCPSCSHKFYSQTKLTDCEMRTFSRGSKVPLEDCKLEVKDKCKCGFHPVAVIENGKVKAFTKDAPTLREGPWGNTIPVDADREAVVKEINETFMSTVEEVVKEMGK